MMPNQPTIAIGRIAPTPMVSVNPTSLRGEASSVLGVRCSLSAHFSPRGRAVSDLVSRRLSATAKTLFPRGKAGFEGAHDRRRAHAAIDCVASVFPFTSTARKRMLLPAARSNGPA